MAVLSQQPLSPSPVGVFLEEAWQDCYQYTEGKDASFKRDGTEEKAYPMLPEILGFLVDDVNMFISYQVIWDIIMLGQTFDLLPVSIVRT